MLPSSTVENYLKAIYQGQVALTGPEELVPMGQVASAVGVTPPVNSSPGSCCVDIAWSSSFSSR